MGSCWVGAFGRSAAAGTGGGIVIGRVAVRLGNGGGGVVAGNAGRAGGRDGGSRIVSAAGAGRGTV